MFFKSDFDILGKTYTILLSVKLKDDLSSM